MLTDIRYYYSRSNHSLTHYGYARAALQCACARGFATSCLNDISDSMPAEPSNESQQVQW